VSTFVPDANGTVVDGRSRRNPPARPAASPSASKRLMHRQRPPRSHCSVQHHSDQRPLTPFPARSCSAEPPRLHSDHLHPKRVLTSATSPGFPQALAAALILRTLQGTSPTAVTRACPLSRGMPAQPHESLDDATLALIPFGAAGRGRCLISPVVRRKRTLAFGGWCAPPGGSAAGDRSLQPDHLLEPGQEDLAAFLRPPKGVTVVASLPCYLKEKTSRNSGAAACLPASIEGFCGGSTPGLRPA